MHRILNCCSDESFWQSLNHHKSISPKGSTVPMEKIKGLDGGTLIRCVSRFQKRQKYCTAETCLNNERMNKKCITTLDFQKAFSVIDQSMTQAVMESYRMDSRLIGLLNNKNENAKAAVRVDKEIREWFNRGRNTTGYHLASSSLIQNKS